MTTRPNRPMPRTRGVTFRYLAGGRIYRLSNGRGRLRAWLRACDAGREFVDMPGQLWLKADPVEALAAIVASGCYRDDNRHPAVVAAHCKASR